MILAGIGGTVAALLWMQGWQLRQNRFLITIRFENAEGIDPGVNVRYRGVDVGRVIRAIPTSRAVDVTVELEPASLRIPSNVEAVIQSSGVLGERFIALLPQGAPAVALDELPPPRAHNCPAEKILCNQSVLKGERQETLSDLVANLNKVALDFQEAQVVTNINQAFRKTGQAADDVRLLARQLQGQIDRIEQAFDTVQATAASLNAVILANRTTVAATLVNLQDTSRSLRLAVRNLEPATQRISQGPLLQNLETLSANLVQASADVRNITQAVNSPETLVILQQTLDSARATFQNAEKITADIDRLTGDPKFIENFKRLVQGLGRLVSSADQLEQQIANLQSQPTRVPLPPLETGGDRILLPQIPPAAGQALSGSGVSTPPLPRLALDPATLPQH
jgi:phospholipid/cholesterol/gamma-HCH transport system substrate-binding protein